MNIEIEETRTPVSEFLVEIALADIAPRPGNREVGGVDKTSLKELAQSMKADGLHQPIIVRPAPGKKAYQVVAGERRYRAAKLLRREKITCIVREYTDEAAERELRKLLPALMTSSGGLKAAAIQGQFDPEFTEAIAPLYQPSPEQ